MNDKIQFERHLKKIDFAARIWLTPDARERLNFIKHANLRRYLAIGEVLLKLLYTYGDSPNEEQKIDLKKFKELAHRINPPSKRYGRKII